METPGPALRQRSVPGTSSSTTVTHGTNTDIRKNNADLKSSDQTSSILSSSVQGASYLVLLQFVSRMLTFTLNQILLRYTSAETLGIASVQLELLLNTILFLSREGVRCAAIRVSDDRGGSTMAEQNTNEKSSDVRTIKKGNVDTKSIADAYKLQKFVNLVYAPIPVGALMTCAAAGYYLSLVDASSESRFPGYRLSIGLYGLSALVELLAEPMFMVAQYKLWFKTRVSVEGTAVIVRCVLTCVLTVYGGRASAAGRSDEGDAVQGAGNTMGVLAFAIAQFVYSLLTLGGFLLSFWNRSSEKRDLERSRMASSTKNDAITAMSDTEDNAISLKALLPRRLVRTGKDGRGEHFYFDSELLRLSQTLTVQSLLKHILTEGDKMMVVWFTDENDQGIYAFVLNYGSLVARILFQPLEETSRTLFSKLLADVGPGSKPVQIDSSTTTESKLTVNTVAHTGLTESQLENLVLSRNLLLTIMKFHILLGLVFIAFGTHYTATLIDLVVGRYWSKTIAPAVLSLYCYYVPIMGLNGITEAVVQAVASDKELAVLSYWMVGFSAVFCSTGAFLMGVMGLGAKGIVLANCVNLSMRIFWSMWFLSGYFGRYIPVSTSDGLTARGQNVRGTLGTFAYVPWRNIIPRPTVLFAFGSAYVITAVSELWVGWERLYNKGIHLGIGIATFGIVMVVVYMVEKQFLRDIQHVVRQRRK